MKRRELLNFVGLGLVASSLPVAITACTPSNLEATTDPEADTSSTDTPAEIDNSLREDGFVALGTVTNGPATASLGTYEAKVEGDLVLVKAT